MEDYERLEKDIERDMKTVMVGSLAIVEAIFGDLWGHNDSRQLTEEEEYLQELYEKVRKEIFDNGNKQINITKNRLKEYDIKSKRFKLTLPIKKRG